MSNSPGQHVSAALDLSGRRAGNVYYNESDDFEYEQNPFNYTRFHRISTSAVVDQVVQYARPDLVPGNLDQTKWYNLPSSTLTAKWIARFDTETLAIDPFMVLSNRGFSGVDANGNAYLTGNYAFPNDVYMYHADSSLAFTRGNMGESTTQSQMGALAKYDAQGRCEWATFIRNFSSGGQVQIYGATTDNAGVTYLCGQNPGGTFYGKEIYFTYANDPFNGLVVNLRYPPTGGSGGGLNDHSFVTAYGPDGIPRWGVLIPLLQKETGSIWVDNVGNVYVQGVPVHSTLRFFVPMYNGEEQLLVKTIETGTPASLVLVKIDTSTGRFQWATYMNGFRLVSGVLFEKVSSTLGDLSETQKGANNQSLVVDAEENVYLLGSYVRVDAMYNAATIYTTPTATTVPLPPYSTQLSWYPREVERQWSAIALNGNGQFMVAAEANGYLFVSSDFGKNWIQRGSLQNWRALYCNDLGDVMIAVVYGGFIYRSIDYGESWELTTGKGRTARNWNAVSGNTTGTVLLASALDDYIYRSTDSGKTWSIPTSPVSSKWSSLSFDETYSLFAAVTSTGLGYVSTDSGNSWANLTFAGLLPAGKNWTAIAGSRTASRLTPPGIPVPFPYQFFLTAQNDKIYGVGSWNGVYFTTVNILDATPRMYSSIAVASWPASMFAAVDDGAVYQSIWGYETVWTPTSIPRRWKQVAMSTDGVWAAGVTTGGQIYVTSQYYPGKHTFLVKYNRDGVIQWINYVNCPSSSEGENQGRTLAVSPVGNVVVTGSFSQDIEFYRASTAEVNNFSLPIKTLSRFPSTMTREARISGAGENVVSREFMVSVSRSAGGVASLTLSAPPSTFGLQSGDQIFVSGLLNDNNTFNTSTLVSVTVSGNVLTYANNVGTRPLATEAVTGNLRTIGKPGKIWLISRAANVITLTIDQPALTYYRLDKDMYVWITGLENFGGTLNTEIPVRILTTSGNSFTFTHTGAAFPTTLALGLNATVWWVPTPHVNRYVVSYSPDGLPQWVNGMYAQHDGFVSMDTDTLGNVYAYGDTDDVVLYNPDGRAVFVNQEYTKRGPILVKYFPNGYLQSFTRVVLGPDEGLQFKKDNVLLSATISVRGENEVYVSGQNIFRQLFEMGGWLPSSSTYLTQNLMPDGRQASTSQISSPSYLAYHAFDADTTGTYWRSNNAYQSSTGDYTGTYTTSVYNSFTGTTQVLSGEWLQLKWYSAFVVYGFSLTLSNILGTPNFNFAPYTFSVAGSNDGSSWNLVCTLSEVKWYTATQSFVVPTVRATTYSYYRMIITKVGTPFTTGRTGVQIANWSFNLGTNAIRAYDTPGENANQLPTAQYLNVENTLAPAGASIAQPVFVPGVFLVKYLASDSVAPGSSYVTTAYNTVFQPQIRTGGGSLERIDGFVRNGDVEIWGGITGAVPDAIRPVDANAAVICYTGHQPGYTLPLDNGQPEGDPYAYRLLCTQLSEPTFPSNDPQPTTPATIPYGYLPIFLPLPNGVTEARFNNATNDSSNLTLTTVPAGSAWAVLQPVQPGDQLRIWVTAGEVNAYVDVQVAGMTTDSIVFTQNTRSFCRGLGTTVPAVVQLFARGLSVNPCNNLVYTGAFSPSGTQGGELTVAFGGGYYISASSNYTTFGLLASGLPLGGTPVYAFDADDRSTWHGTWGAGLGYNGTTGVYAGSKATVSSGQTILGDWLQIQFPVVNANFWPTGLRIVPRQDYAPDKRSPRLFVLCASPDGDTWVTLYDNRATTGIVNWSKAAQTVLFTAGTTVYRYYRFVITRVGNYDNDPAADQLSIQINDLRILGRPTPCALHPTFNFPYAQNAFGTGDDYQTGYDAAYIASASSGGSVAFRGFDAEVTTVWSSTAVYNASSGVYTGSASTPLDNGQTILGEWLQIQIPTAIRASGVQITPRQDALATKQSPRLFVLCGTNDGIVSGGPDTPPTQWTVLYDNRSGGGVTNWSKASQMFTLPAPSATAYRIFRLVVVRVGNFAVDPANEQHTLQIADLRVCEPVSNANPNLTAFYAPEVIETGTLRLHVEIDPKQHM